MQTSDLKILICDDDPLLLELVEFRLQSKGYDVTMASDGQEAISIVETQSPDLVVLDAMMPKLDGFEVLARIKNNPKICETPVIMLTARRMEKDIVAALEAGADDYLVKPFIPEELFARIARLITRQRRSG